MEAEKTSEKQMIVNTSDQAMAQATFAAILAAMKGDDAKAAEILRSMGDSMLEKFGPRKGVKAHG